MKTYKIWAFTATQRRQVFYYYPNAVRNGEIFTVTDTCSPLDRISADFWGFTPCVVE